MTLSVQPDPVAARLSPSLLSSPSCRAVAARPDTDAVAEDARCSASLIRGERHRHDRRGVGAAGRRSWPCGSVGGGPALTRYRGFERRAAALGDATHRNDDGVVRFEVGVDPEDATRYVGYEIWASQDVLGPACRPASQPGPVVRRA